MRFAHLLYSNSALLARVDVRERERRRGDHRQRRRLPDHLEEGLEPRERPQRAIPDVQLRHVQLLGQICVHGESRIVQTVNWVMDTHLSQKKPPKLPYLLLLYYFTYFRSVFQQRPVGADP